MRHGTSLALLATVLAMPAVLLADTLGKGEGGIVIADDVPVYKSSDGDKKLATFARGDAVAALASVLSRDFVFNEKDGRVQVKFFPNAEQVGIPWDGWVDPNQLSKFTYDCSCSTDKGCSPTQTRGLRGKITMNSEWNVCFREARDAQLAKLQATNWGSPNSDKPKTVALGQTPPEVETILGPPQKILNAGSKVIYVYSDLKVIFQDGKVADLQ